MNYYHEFIWLEEAAMALIPAVTSAVPSVLLRIASYVLTSLTLYTMASRRGVKHAWLGWVPLLNVWIIGSLSDQYRYVVKGQFRSKRKWLLILKLVSVLLSLGGTVAAAVVVMDLAEGIVYGTGMDTLLRLLVGPLMGVLVFALPLAGIAIAVAVIRYMALYDIYTSMDPGNSVMFLVLSILFSVTEPFFLFFNRNRDGGMPPRREEPVYEPPRWDCQESTEETKDYL